MKKKVLKKLLKSRSREVAELRVDLRKAIDALPEGGVKYDLDNKYPFLKFHYFVPEWFPEMVKKYGNLNFSEFGKIKE